MALTSSRVLESKIVSITNTAQTITDLGFNAANIKAADVIMVTVESPCRFSLDGSAPTASVGHYLDGQVDREFAGTSLIKAIKFIRVGGSDVAGYITLAKI